MTNWTPSEDHVFRLQQVVNHLTNRRATMMEADYPLSFDQVVQIVSPPRLLEFIGLGYDSLQKTNHICYELGPEHGLGRRSVTHVSLPHSIQYAFNRQLTSHYSLNNPIYFNREGIDDELMERLKQWTEKAVYERRLAMLATATVAMFFTHLSTPGARLSMYQIMARWPELKVVFPRVSSINYRGGDMWERHSNEVPRNLQRWTWPQFGPEADWRVQNTQRMKLTEEVLLSCVSLSEPKDERNYNQPRKLTAKLADWQKLGGAPF